MYHPFHFFCAVTLLLSCSGKIPDAAASASAVTGTAASDMFYDVAENTTARQRGNPVPEWHTRYYLAASGNVRIEREMPRIAGNAIAPVILIGSMARKNQTILIDSAEKTYTVNNIDSPDLRGMDKVVSQVTRIGEEAILGYRSVHVRVVSEKTMAMLHIADTLDIWKSGDVPVPPVFGDWMSTFENKAGAMIYAADVPAKLKQMGCTGFTTRLVMHTKSSTATLQLEKAEHRDLPESLFRIPAGFTENKDEH